LQNSLALFLSVDEVVEIDRLLIKRFGGADGIRDLGLLESALYRPRTGYYENLVDMAAAMFESLINNHPFTGRIRSLTVIEDPIVAEIRRYRKIHADKYGNDLHKICDALRDRQAVSGREVITRQPRLKLQKTGS